MRPVRRNLILSILFATGLAFALSPSAVASPDGKPSPLTAPLPAPSSNPIRQASANYWTRSLPGLTGPARLAQRLRFFPRCLPSRPTRMPT